MTDGETDRPKLWILANWGTAVGVVVLAFALGYVVFWGFSPAREKKADPPMAASGGQPEQSDVVWTCSMHPEVRLPKPGLCPKCRMDLIPVRRSTEEMGGLREFTTSKNAKALMDIETSTAERRFVATNIRMVGKIDYDETKLVYITAWVPGRLDRLFVDYTGVPVRKGDHMVLLYSPELLTAQEELLQALKAVKNLKDSDMGIVREMTESMVRASRERLRLWGLNAEQIKQVETRGKATDHMTIYAPSSGIVIHKNAQEGMYVNTGSRIYTVADLSQVWVKLDAYESDLMWLRYGQRVNFTAVSYPGETFTGTISFIDPILDRKTRTVKVRVNAANLAGKLKPEMFVKAVVHTQVAAGGRVMDPALAGKWICPMHPSVIKETSGDCDICEMPLARTESLGYVSAEATASEKPLVVPATAVMRTGTRAIVYVALPDRKKPTYEGREIVLGPRVGDHYIVRHGLKEGDRVVTRGGFKIDAALQIEAKPSMMTPEGGGGSGGHDHGGAAGKPKAGPGVKADGNLSALGRHQLQTVLSSADRVGKAVKGKDLVGIRSAFAGLEKSIRNVDMNQFKKHAHLQWMELSMRLTNDAVEGKEAKTLQEAQGVAASLASNASSLRAKFGLAHGQGAAPAAPLDPVFRKQLDDVTQKYFRIQEALAGDKADVAIAAAAEMQKALAQVDLKLLTGKDHELWMEYAKSLTEILSSAADAKDIEGSRKVFALLSEQMLVVVKRLGSPGSGPVYNLRCPMAFNNRGATWLQGNDQTRNPYFGAAMLQCGSVIEVIPARQGEEGHGHD